MKPIFYAVACLMTLIVGIWIVAFIANVLDIPEWVKVCSILTVIILGLPFMGYLCIKFDLSLK